MRTWGIAIFGLFSGLLVGLICMEVVARIAVANGTDIGGSVPLSLFIGFVAPALAIVGAVLALWIDGRVRTRR